MKHRLNPRWRKVARDLWGNKTRTVLVVLSIAVGIFAVGLIAGTQAVLFEDMNTIFRASNPAQAVLFAGRSDGGEPADDLFDDALVEAVRRTAGVQDAEGRTEMGVRLRMDGAEPAGNTEEFQRLELQAIANYDDIHILKIWPQRGAWPPPKHAFLIERASLDFAGAEVGDRVTVKTADGKLHQMLLAGVVYDPDQASPTVEGGELNGYISLETLEWLGEPRNFAQINLTVTGDKSDKEYIQKVADKAKLKIENSGRKVGFTWLPTSDEHPANEVLKPMFFLLSALGFLALLLSGFLVVNTVSALLAQQVRQIGIMKTIGGQRSQIIGLYLVTVLIFSLLSLAIAIPLGAGGAYIFAGYMASLVNFDIASSTLTPQVLGLELAVGLIVPLLAALYPVLNGTRLTVREAISSYGLGQGHFGSSWIDRLFMRMRYFLALPRPHMLSLRNTFRRKGRLSLTLLTLTLASAIFMSVFSVRASMQQTLDEALQYWKYDLSVDFDRAERIQQIEREALQVPGVVRAESWNFARVKRLRPSTPTEKEGESRGFLMIALPAETQMLQPTLLAGRWLQPEDQQAVVINTDLLKDEPDIAVGDEIQLELEERKSTWQVVGLVRTTLSGPRLYANYPYFTQEVREVGRAISVQIITDQHDATAVTAIAKALESRFEQAGMKVSAADIIAAEKQRIETVFNIIAENSAELFAFE